MHDKKIEEPGDSLVPRPLSHFQPGDGLANLPMSRVAGAYVISNVILFDSLLVSWLGSEDDGQSGRTGLSPGSKDRCIPVLK